jgi:hypothetical protein
MGVYLWYKAANLNLSDFKEAKRTWGNEYYNTVNNGGVNQHET